MAYLGGGGEMCFCNPSDGTVYEDTTSGTFDTAKARCSIGIGANANTSSYAQWEFTSGTTTPNVGFMACQARPGTGGEYTWWQLIDNGGIERAAITVQRVDGTGSWETYLRFYVHNGTAPRTQVGGIIQVNLATNQKFDVEISASSATLYIAKTAAIGPVSGSYVPGTAAKIQMYSVYNRHYVSEMILSDASTVRLRGYTDYPTGDGPDTDWSGTYADIDDLAYSDVDGISTGSNDDVQTVTGSDPDLEGFAVESVLIGARGALGTTGPTGIQLSIESGNASYYLTSTKTLSAGYVAKVGVHDVDPGTSAAWVAADAIAANYGVKSKA